MVSGQGPGAPRKPKQSAKRTPADEKPVGLGHNATDAEQDKALNSLAVQACQQIEAKLRIAAQAQADARNIRKRAKAEGVSPARLNFMLELRANPDAATEKYQQLVADLQKAASWASHELRHQGTLFGETDRTPLDDKAFEQGRQAGLAGETCNVPVNYAGHAAATKWTEGWQDGQDTLAKGGFKQLALDHVETTVKRGAPKPKPAVMVEAHDEEDDLDAGPWNDGLGDAPDTTKPVH